MSTYDSQTGRLAPQAFLQKRYMIVRQAGKGGMGAVYEAVDTRSGQQRVAIKEMSQGHLNSQELVTATAQFQREAHLLGSLSHPNLPHIFDSFNERGRSYLVMEFIDGKTLHQLLRERPGQPLPLEQVIEYGCQLCNVLTYLHQHIPPIIFRDVKPANVMVTKQGQVFLIDFGIARFFTEGKEQDTIQLGSPGYAPPEQHGSSQTSPRSDIYGLGATLHYCLTGRDPYHAQDHFAFAPIRQVNPQVPIEMERLIQQMVAMDERQRPASADEVLQALLTLNKQANDNTMAIYPDASAPTLYQMPPNRSAHLQPTILPDAFSAYGAGQHQILSKNAGLGTGPSFWSTRFTGLFLLALLISTSISAVIMNVIYTPLHFGWAWLAVAILTGISCLAAFVSCILVRQGLARLLLLLTGLFTLFAGICALTLALPDVQAIFSYKISLADLTFLTPLSLALAACSALGWIFRSGPWSARICQLLLSAITLIFTLVAANTISTTNTPGQESFAWYLLLLGGTIALLLSILLGFRMGHLAEETGHPLI